MMKRYLTVCSILLIILYQSMVVKAQSIPVGSVGIVFSYDAAGNRTKAEYVVNNTQATVKEISAISVKEKGVQILKVDALYPNPTTGRITVRLVKPLNKGHVQILDISGHALVNGIENGSILSFNLSGYPAGIYLLYINQDRQKVTMKILKR
ncbi:MAG TPA: T9SS type A sorting domain-containing protein [Arachidicoccus sp.]|nr:T9SS type A sorting domain-containing protein [Arachidicoccus sp.]